MIVDSSVWIDYLRSGRGAAVDALDAALRRREATLLPVILQEVLQGAESAQRFAAWQRAFDELPLALVADAGRTAVRAAALYARCRWSGVAPRSANDCLIAASCIELDEPLLHQDRDFERIVGVDARLRLVALSVR